MCSCLSVLCTCVCTTNVHVRCPFNHSPPELLRQLSEPGASWLAGLRGQPGLRLRLSSFPVLDHRRMTMPNFYIGDRDLNSGLMFAWQVLNQLSHLPRDLIFHYNLLSSSSTTFPLLSLFIYDCLTQFINANGDDSAGKNCSLCKLDPSSVPRTHVKSKK